MSAAVRPPSRPLLGRRGEYALAAVVFLLPLFLGLIVFQWIPLGVAVRNSMLRFNPLNPDAAVFVGLGNFVALLGNPRFIHAVGNTLLFITLKVVIEIPLGLGLAMLVNRPAWGARVARSAVFAALIASDAVAALVWNVMYNPDTGLFNALLGAVGIAPQPFLTSSAQALPAIAAMVIWKSVGLTMLILLAGLQTIPAEFYEAAAIDGAGAWTRFRFVTLPLLRRMLLLATFMVTVNGNNIFASIILTTEGGPQDATVNLVYFMYEQAFRFQRMGDASATAVLMIALLIVITLVQGLALRTSHEY
jgi:ABC-type sugar transport system permease subunit